MGSAGIDMSPQLTPETRIASAAEEVSRYVGEIAQMLRDLSDRPGVDNEQLTKIAVAIGEIKQISALMLRR
jgi:hypothetical protein